MGNFMVMDDNYDIKNGEVIAIFKIDDSEKEYILYSINEDNNSECKLLVAHFKRNKDTLNYIESIIDEEEKNNIIKILRGILRGDNNE